MDVIGILFGVLGILLLGCILILPFVAFVRTLPPKALT